MIANRIEKRIHMIFICACMIFGAILLKLGYEQVVNQDFTMRKAMDLWQRDFPVSGSRGAIVDRFGKKLAYDIPSTSVMVVPAQIKDPKDTANKLAKILNCDQSVLYQKLTNRVSTQKLQPEGRLISGEVAEQLENANLDGVYLIQDTLRYYPNRNYLAQVLGFTGIDNQGLAGLELQYENVLGAKKGALEIPFDAKGNRVDLYKETYEASGKGMDVMLTIDSNIQDIVEREMNNLMKRYHPKEALALAMNPNNGEILAMVSKPDFDPNAYQKYDSKIINRNLPIWKSYEPGSTFKSVTFSSALDLNLFDMFRDTYYDRGYEMVGGARIKSWKAGGHGLQTFLQVLENSSNPGFVEISRRMGLDHLYQYVTEFGFGKKTNVDLPGESTGIMFQKEAMGEVEQATVAFGQGLSVTPIQLVRAFSAIINGGVLYEPHITKAILNPSTNEIIQETKPKVVKRVIRQETSDQMRYALESVVANGGGRPAYMKGYQIGGKTGTAQKAVNGVYLSNEYILSFLSAAPMNHPEIVLYVAVDAPNNDVQYGGTVVAPVVKACYEDILPYLKISKVKQQIPKKTTWLDPVEIEVENYIGKQKDEVKQEGLVFEWIGEGNQVIAQQPKAGTTLKEGGKVWVYLGNDLFS